MVRQAVHTLHCLLYGIGITTSTRTSDFKEVAVASIVILSAVIVALLIALIVIVTFIVLTNRKIASNIAATSMKNNTLQQKLI